MKETLSSLSRGPVTTDETTTFKGSVDALFDSTDNIYPLKNISITPIPARLTLSIQGMTCASCVASIERHLRQQPGIVSVKVALLAERAEVEYHANVIKNKLDIAEMVNDIGFEASVLSDADLGVVDLSIFGMTCARYSKSNLLFYSR